MADTSLLCSYSVASGFSYYFFRRPRWHSSNLELDRERSTTSQAMFTRGRGRHTAAGVYICSRSADGHARLTRARGPADLPRQPRTFRTLMAVNCLVDVTYRYTPDHKEFFNASNGFRYSGVQHILRFVTTIHLVAQSPRASCASLSRTASHVKVQKRDCLRVADPELFTARIAFLDFIACHAMCFLDAEILFLISLKQSLSPTISCALISEEWSGTAHCNPAAIRLAKCRSRCDVILPIARPLRTADADCRRSRTASAISCAPATQEVTCP